MSEYTAELLKSAHVSSSGVILPQGFDGTDYKVVAVNTDGVLKVVPISQYPTGATPFISTGQSSAATAQTLTIAAGGAGVQHYILGYLVAIHTAAAGNDVVITLSIEDVIKLRDVIGNGSPIGTSATLTGGGMPIAVTGANEHIDFTIPSSGSGSITVATIWGYTL